MIWVMVRDNYTEGFGPPLQAANSKAEIENLVALANEASYGSFKIFEVPVWPEGLADKSKVTST